MMGSLEIKNSSIKGREIRKIHFQFSSRNDSKSKPALQWKYFRLVTVMFKFVLTNFVKFAVTRAWWTLKRIKLNPSRRIIVCFF